jgi:hypothetical protein
MVDRSSHFAGLDPPRGRREPKRRHKRLNRCVHNGGGRVGVATRPKCQTVIGVNGTAKHHRKRFK